MEEAQQHQIKMVLEQIQLQLLLLLRLTNVLDRKNHFIDLRVVHKRIVVVVINAINKRMSCVNKPRNNLLIVSVYFFQKKIKTRLMYFIFVLLKNKSMWISSYFTNKKISAKIVFLFIN
jgi:hypothetical protein